MPSSVRVRLAWSQVAFVIASDDSSGGMRQEGPPGNRLAEGGIRLRLSNTDATLAAYALVAISEHALIKYSPRRTACGAQLSCG